VSLIFTTIFIIQYLFELNFVNDRFEKSHDKNSHLFSNFINLLVWTKLGSEGTFGSLLVHRKNNSTKFTIHICSILLLLAYFSNIFSGFQLCLLLVYSVILGPVLISKQFHVHFFSKIEPYKQKLMTKLDSFSQKYLDNPIEDIKQTK